MDLLTKRVVCECGFDFSEIIEIQVHRACTLRVPPIIEPVQSLDEGRDPRTLCEPDNTRVTWNYCMGCGTKISPTQKKGIREYTESCYQAALRAVHGPLS